MNEDCLLVFDWDGTLVDSLEIKIANAARLFQRAFGSPAAAVDEAYRRHTGIPRRQLFAAIAADVGAPGLTDELYATLSDQFTQANQQAIEATPVPADTIDTLARLAARRYPLYISSSAAPEEIRPLAQKLGLADYFQEILGSTGDFTKGPVHIAHILTRHNTPQALLFIGDDPADVILGRQAGAITVAKAGTHAPELLQACQPDYFIQRLGELIDLVDRLVKA